MADKFLIAPIDKNSGLQTNRLPWLIPDNAFSFLQNAYVWRGRVKKRFGTDYLTHTTDQTLTRLRVNIGTNVIGGGSQFFTAPGVNNLTQIGQQISIQYMSGPNLITEWFTVVALGNQLMLSNSSAEGTFDTTNGNITLVDAGVGTVYYYPGTPVMGILSEDTIVLNNEPVIAFDTQFAYQYQTGWQRLATEAAGNAGAATWSGNDSEFFWGTMWYDANPSQKALFVTNFNSNEYMRYLYNGSWYFFYPQIDEVPNYLLSAQILVVFKNCMLAFNTFEGPDKPGVNYQNRCRYSGFGSPTFADAWNQDLPGNGNFIDAATTEAIITVEFVKDRLIVFFERSTWEIAFTGNNANPFVFQKINTELGAYSPFSVVPFDKFALGIGNVGIHSCNGFETQRIDANIPDQVFEINQSNNGPARVSGIRDYYTELVYWNFPSNEQSVTQLYPNAVLVYNYENNSWAVNDESITCMGYFQPVTGILWSSDTPWQSELRWDDGSAQSGFRDVIGGNQQGWTFILDSTLPANSPNLAINNLTLTSTGGTGYMVTVTCINHNLSQDQVVTLNNIADTGNIGATINGVPSQITMVPNQNTFIVNYNEDTLLSGVYTGGGTLATIAQIDIQTKEFNFYAKDGRNAYISKIDFMVSTTGTGQIQVDYQVATDETSMTDTSELTGALLGTGTLDLFPYTALYPYEATSSRVWHPVYFQGDGEVIQFRIYYNLAQLLNVATAYAPFEMHALSISATPSSRLQ
jgi:hypothetical protein